MGFIDSDTANSYAISGINQAVDEDLIQGNKGYLNPQDDSTKVQASAIMHHFLTK